MYKICTGIIKITNKLKWVSSSGCWHTPMHSWKHPSHANYMCCCCVRAVGLTCPCLAWVWPGRRRWRADGRTSWCPSSSCTWTLWYHQPACSWTRSCPVNTNRQVSPRWEPEHAHSTTFRLEQHMCAFILNIWFISVAWFSYFLTVNEGVLCLEVVS